MTVWESFTAEELRTAAKVARASGGVVMAGAAAAWDVRASLIEQYEKTMAEELDYVGR